MTKNSAKRQAKITRREVSFFNAIVVQMKCCVTLMLQVLHNLSTFRLSKEQLEISHLSCEMLRNIPYGIQISKDSITGPDRSRVLINDQRKLTVIYAK